jgi:hypothetical protein
MAFGRLTSLYFTAYRRSIVGSLWSPSSYSCCHVQALTKETRVKKIGENHIQPSNVCNFCTWSSFIHQ